MTSDPMLPLRLSLLLTLPLLPCLRAETAAPAAALEPKDDPAYTWDLTPLYADVAAFDAAKAKLAENPDDLEARFSLAGAAWLSGRAEMAMDELLEIVKRDREFREDGARRALVVQPHGEIPHGGREIGEDAVGLGQRGAPQPRPGHDDADPAFHAANLSDRG